MIAQERAVDAMVIESVADQLEHDLDEAMEQQPRRSSSVDTASWALRGANLPSTDVSHANERAVSFTSLPPESDGAAEGGLRRRDWSSALDLVQEACEAIRIRDDRVEELERQSMQLAAQTRDELKHFQGQLQAAQRQIQQAEARAEKAEARAAEAETWLARLDEAIKSGFGGIAGAGSGGL